MLSRITAFLMWITRRFFALGLLANDPIFSWTFAKLFWPIVYTVMDIIYFSDSDNEPMVIDLSYTTVNTTIVQPEVLIREKQSQIAGNQRFLIPRIKIKKRWMRPKKIKQVDPNIIFADNDEFLSAIGYIEY